jgi:hypothetical protein
MTPHITIEPIWSDEHIVEFEITTSDGCSRFCVKVYAGRPALESLIADLERFKSEVYGGIYDVEFGQFGPEYASGAYQARLHFDPSGRGRLWITVKAESDWHTLGIKEVASQATLYLESEPGLLDNFIKELRRLNSGSTDKATFECIARPGTPTGRSEDG